MIEGITVVTKEQDKSRVTNWVNKKYIGWLEREKDRIESEGGGEKCKIFSHKFNSGVRKYALFYTNGHFKINNQKGTCIFISKNR